MPLYVICLGTPADGFELIGDEHGKAYESYEAVLKDAETIHEEAWWIMEIKAFTP